MAVTDVQVSGGTGPLSAPVRDAFAGVVSRQRGTGAALPVRAGGEWVLDL